MQCTSPAKYHPDGTFITTLPPCGSCLSCRLNDRAVWASRLVCERQAHDQAQFLTLTYRDSDLPESQAACKKSFQKFIDRYRKAYDKPRYFAVLEYGTRHGRAHWHAIFFGKDTTYESRSKSGHKYVVDPTIEDTWQMGSTYVKDCGSETQTMNITNYVGAYLLKGLWDTSGSTDLAKQECSLQSRAPYIGKPYMNKLLELICSKSGAKRCAALGTVPDRIKFGKRYYRLYHRIRKDLCAELGYPYLPVPHNDGTIIDINGNYILKETTHGPKTQAEANARELVVRSKISNNRRKNTATSTG